MEKLARGEDEFTARSEKCRDALLRHEHMICSLSEQLSGFISKAGSKEDASKAEASSVKERGPIAWAFRTALLAAELDARIKTYAGYFDAPQGTVLDLGYGDDVFNFGSRR